MEDTPPVLKEYGSDGIVFFSLFCIVYESFKICYLIFKDGPSLSCFGIVENFRDMSELYQELCCNNQFDTLIN